MMMIRMTSNDDDDDNKEQYLEKDGTVCAPLHFNLHKEIGVK
jgi:hypothetical protein